MKREAPPTRRRTARTRPASRRQQQSTEPAIPVVVPAFFTAAERSQLCVRLWYDLDAGRVTPALANAKLNVLRRIAFEDAVLLRQEHEARVRKSIEAQAMPSQRPARAMTATSRPQ